MHSTQTKDLNTAPASTHTKEGWLRNFLATQALAIIAIALPLALVAFSIAAERALAGL
jgi:hypothetical protein